MRERPFKLQAVMDATGLPSQTLRHWRDVLPPLRDRIAHRPCFSAGDLLALKVLDYWVHRVGAKVGALKECSVELFELCNREAWSKLERSHALTLDLASFDWSLDDTQRLDAHQSGAVLFPISEFVRDLSEHLIGNYAPRQLDMPLLGVLTAKVSNG